MMHNNALTMKCNQRINQCNYFFHIYVYINICIKKNIKYLNSA